MTNFNNYQLVVDNSIYIILRNSVLDLPLRIPAAILTADIIQMSIA
jgi:hypothetical protein